MTRPSFVEVDLDAIAYNAAVLAEVARPARLCAVVKADGYGHGAVPAARAALAGGADMLGVACIEEALAFYRSVGATVFVERAERLLAASYSESA